MNIIYYNPDEMRADMVSCYGNDIIKTPNFDRLAKNGTVFEQCHVQHTVCRDSCSIHKQLINKLLDCVNGILSARFLACFG